MNNKKIFKLLFKYKWCVAVVCLVWGICSYMKLQTTEGFDCKAESFDEAVSNGKKLVWFYAPWCGHCKTMHAAWDEACVRVNKNGEKPMVKIDVGDKANPKHSEICKRFNIKGFPTILGLNNGSPSSVYDNDRTSSGFISFLKTM